ncbi:MAG: hypothetical protein ACPLW7_01750, partial [Minisyncoccia bacterium]
GNPNSYDISKLLYGSGKFGIMAEASGIVLLKKNYTGQIVYYDPLFENFNFNQFNLGPKSIQGNGYLMATNLTNTMIWYGPYTGLPPGVYNITFQIRTDNNSKDNLLTLDVSSDKGKNILISKTINGSAFNYENRWTNISLTINLTNFYGYVEFRGYAIKWNGLIEMKNVIVKQISPPFRSKEFYELYNMMNLIPSNSTIYVQNGLPDPIPELSTGYNLQNNISSSTEYIIVGPYTSSYYSGNPNSYDISKLLYGSGKFVMIIKIFKFT